MSTYRVNRGDTLSTVARRFHTSVAALAQANGIADVNRIRVGQRLQIPDGFDGTRPSGSAGTARAPTSGLWRGARGPEVEALQRDLVRRGHMTQAEMDSGRGVFGAKTERAVRKFQAQSGQVVDGWFGPQSSAAMQRARGGEAAPAAAPTAAPSGPVAPGAPPNDYSRVRFRGQLVNVRTKTMIEQAEAVLRSRGLNVTIGVSQGSYNHGAVAASAGTHDGGGTVDLSVRAYPKATQKQIVKALREVGFAAWLRGYHDSLPVHIHAIAIGDREMSSQARGQVRSFFAGRDGLKGNRVDPDADVGRSVPAWAHA